MHLPPSYIGIICAVGVLVTVLADELSRRGWDVDVVAAVRSFIGDDVMLQVDANAAYTLDDLETLQALDEYELACIEQPLAWDALVEHAPDAICGRQAKVELELAHELRRQFTQTRRFRGYVPRLDRDDMCCAPNVETLSVEQRLWMQFACMKSRRAVEHGT